MHYLEGKWKAGFHLIAIQFKVCHWSAFQTISVRSVNIKKYYQLHWQYVCKFEIFNASMQQKNSTPIQIEKRFTGDYILLWKDL